MHSMSKVLSGLVAISLVSCGVRSESSTIERAQQAAHGFAEETASFIQRSSAGERETFVANFKALPVETFYDLLAAVVPRGQVALGDKVVSDFVKVVGSKQNQIDAYAKRYKNVGELVAKERLKISLPSSAHEILYGLESLYDHLRQADAPALTLTDYSWKEIEKSEKSNECMGDQSTSAMPYECYGDFKVTDYRKKHVEEHLQPATRPKDIHTIFVNPGVISAIYRNLKDDMTPVKGPIFNPEHNSDSRWYKMKNAGINGEDFVQVNCRRNKNVVSAYPVKSVP